MKTAQAAGDLARPDDLETLPPDRLAAVADALSRAPPPEAAFHGGTLAVARRGPVPAWMAAALRYTITKYAPMPDEDLALVAAARGLAAGRMRLSSTIAIALDPERRYRLSEREREKLRHFIAQHTPPA